MTASRSREYWLTCNGWYDEGGTYHYCGAEFRTPAELDHFARPAELRRLAAKEGWLSERRSRRADDRDRCPACGERHSPAGYAAALAVIRVRVESECGSTEAAEPAMETPRQVADELFRRAFGRFP